MSAARAPLLDRISDYVTWHARRSPARIALALGDERMSYAELAAAVDAMAAALVAAGVEKGDRVASMHPPHPMFVVEFLASASIGAIWVGLNPKYRMAELMRVLEDCEPAVVIMRLDVAGRDYRGEAAQFVRACVGTRHIVTVEETAVPAGAETRTRFLERGEALSPSDLAGRRGQCASRDPCLIVYTSGSTGRPKGALLHHEGLAVFALTQNQIWPVRKYVGLNYFPINHVGSVADCTLPAIVAGGTLHFLEQFDPSDALALMVKEGVSIWGSVPSTFPMIMDLPEFDPAALSAAELIAWGGAPMPEPVIERLLRVNRSLATNYGMTESTSAITAVSPTDDVELLANSVGIAFPGVEVRLLNSSGVPVAAGAVGEVQARSRMNFLGYWNRPEATRAAFTEDGWLRTGDLAIRREDGRYRIVGRIREMYKSGGYNVYPREVEQAIEDHPAIEVAAVVGVFSPVWHEVGAAFVVLREPLTEAELMAWLRLRLANYKLPKLVYFESGLPLLPIGKIDKEALRKRAQEDGAAGGAGNRRS